MKKLTLVISSLLLLLLIGCAHHRDVRPGADGVHRVILVTSDTADASRSAISQANHFCKERGKAAAFIDEKSEYTGDMDEADYKKAKRISKVAKGVGGAAFVFGKKRVSDAGAVVGLGGQVADSVIGDGYTVEMNFKCI